MRILWLTTRYWPAVGGAELHAQQIIHELARRGHDLCVVTHWDRNRTDWLRGTTFLAPGAVKRYADGDTATVVRLGYPPLRRLRTLLPAMTYYLRQTQSAGALGAMIEADIRCLCGERWDVIHGVRIGREPLYVAGKQMAERLGVPFVFTPLHHPRWVGQRYRVYLDLYRQADALIALTEHERALYQALGVAPERIQVAGIGPILPPAANGARFRAAHRITGPLVLFLGQKYPYKGFNALLAATGHVWRRHPEATFAFLGPRTTASRRLFARVHDQRILELDAVDAQTKGDALAACDVFCLPSEQESFGGVYTEAWSYGKPVIGAAIPTTQELIADGADGLIALPGDAGDLASCVVRLLDDPALRARMGAAGAAKVLARYQWPQITTRIEQAYQAARDRLAQAEKG